MENMDVKAQDFQEVDACFEEDWCDIKQDFPETEKSPEDKDDFVLLEPENLLVTISNTPATEKIDDYFSVEKPTSELNSSEESKANTIVEKEMGSEVKANEEPFVEMGSEVKTNEEPFVEMGSEVKANEEPFVEMGSEVKANEEPFVEMGSEVKTNEEPFVETTDLSFSNSDITDEDLINVLSKNPDISKLDLEGCDNLSPDFLANFEFELSNLNEICLGSTAVSDASILNILKKAPNLKTLNLYFCKNLSPELFTSLEDTLSNLEELELGLTAISDSGALNVLRKTPNLKKLSLLICENISSELFNNLVDEIGSLEELVFDFTAISDAVVLNIIKKAPNLKKLSLRECINLSSELFEGLDIELSNLEELDLHGTSLSDDGALNIIKIAPNLKNLNLN